MELWLHGIARQTVWRRLVELIGKTYGRLTRLNIKAADQLNCQDGNE
jgi:hypothetical protein